MEKFLSIPVTNASGVTTNTLVAVTEVLGIEPAAGAVDTQTEIRYRNGREVTITHASVGAASATNSGTQFRNFLQEEMVKLLQKDWTNVVEVVNPKFAVSAIVAS